MGFLDLFRRPNIPKLENERNWDKLRRALVHGNWHVRRDAAVALVRLKDISGVSLAPILSVLENYPPDSRCSEATQALVTMGQPVVRFLCGILADQYYQNRYYNRVPVYHAVPHIAEALAGIGDRSAAACLAKELQRLVGREVERLKKGDPTALLGRDIVGTVGRAALESGRDALSVGKPLGRSEIEKAVETATRAALDIETRNRCLAFINALASLGGEAAKKAISVARSSPHDDVRRAAEVALLAFDAVAARAEGSNPEIPAG